jgi:hypothetical protein
VLLALLVGLAFGEGAAAPRTARAGLAPQGPPTFTVNSQADVAPVVGTSLTDGVCETVPGNGVCTLRAAVMEANHYPGGGAIIVSPAGTYSLTIAPSAAFTETVGSLDFAARFWLIGAGAATTIIDAGGIDRVLCVRGGAVVGVSGVTLQNGRVSSSPAFSCSYVPGFGAGSTSGAS